MLDRADCADFGRHNSIRLETKHFLNTLALTFISFSGRFVFAMQKHYLFFFCERSSSLTLKERSKVKSGHTKRFPAHDFLYVGLPSQTSRTNNKRVISTFKFGYPRLILMEGPRSNPTTARDSLPMILCRIVYHAKPLGPIIRKL